MHIVPEIASKLNATTQTARDKGRQHTTLKANAKKKRSKGQLEEVKDVEAELKADKQAFLLEVKRLQEIANANGQAQQQIGAN